MTAKQTTETGRVLNAEGYYEAMVESAPVKKTIKKDGIPRFVLYEWEFSAVLKGEGLILKISLFSSQMADLLRALGAVEASPNKFDWDDEEVVGKSISFNLVHVADKNGVMREQLSDIKALGTVSQKQKEDDAWLE